MSGTRKYWVQISREEDDALLAFCQCPYFDGGEICKHIWATLLAAESRHWLGGHQDSPAKRVMLAHDDFEEDNDDEYDGYEEEDDFSDESELGARVLDWRRKNDPRQSREGSRGQTSGRKKSPKATPQQPWQVFIAALQQSRRRLATSPEDQWLPNRQIVYAIDLDAAQYKPGCMVVEILAVDRKQNGEWSKPKQFSIRYPQVERLPNPDDRQILAQLVGASSADTWMSYDPLGYATIPKRYSIAGPLQQSLIPMICRTGRGRFRTSAAGNDLVPVEWDDGEPWEFWVEFRRDADERHYSVDGILKRNGQRMALSEPLHYSPGGLVFTRSRIARLRTGTHPALIEQFRQHGCIAVAAEHSLEVIRELLVLPSPPLLDLPAELQLQEERVVPRPHLQIESADTHGYGRQYVHGVLSFDYDGTTIGQHDPAPCLFRPDRPQVIPRDLQAEQQALALLLGLGFRSKIDYYDRKPVLELHNRNFSAAVKAVIAAGWHIEADGTLYRSSSNIRIEVSSGIDWFELHGSVDFGETSVSFPELLAALKKGENMVRLGDGSFGILPEEWIRKYGVFAEAGTAVGGHLRFKKHQAGLLDALLASQPEATCDEVFAKFRDELNNFTGVEPADPPESFSGQLRGYQRDGLGWLHFLRRFGFGGCLADDMGLGKTVQVLALLEARRAERAPNGAQETAASNDKQSRRKTATKGTPPPAEPPRASLVVVPKSLIFNWKQESARFTPGLRVLDHTGIDRTKGSEHFSDYDLVLTTYGTLRRDAVHFKDTEFDYLILDESQAIKNTNTESAKAARLLRGRYRLALSGTPIENHLGELWSLFEFLNPGMLGASSVLKLGSNAARNPDEETRALLARALRPFILRRTKDRVAKDLPPKSEQSIHCVLDPPQRKLYDELRAHYRRELLGRIERDGINKAKIMILEALLRLRQAACHPGLIDKSKGKESSAKLDVLLPRLSEVIDEGHKALVFSQFTSFLAIVRAHLDREKIPYEYLDGKTRDRAARVERFQTDNDCKLFLVSLKAGGLGLNLTAAEYVFLLDPWWNPAVEAQAIDRTHRIGQSRSVFAYRLIARDTVEEKILQLQQTKRNLADAIITADNSLIRGIGREDLELLLS